MECVWNCQRVILGWFYNYGYFLAKHPFYFLVIPIIICGGLAVGFMLYDPVNDVEYLYAPSSSRAIDDREIMRKTFPDLSDNNYSPFSQNELIKESRVIFRSKEEKAVLNDEVLDELGPLYYKVITMNITYNGQLITFADVCKRQKGGCVIYGGFVFDKSFRDKLKKGYVTYPIWPEQPGTDMSLIFAKVNVSQSGTLLSAGSLKITLPVKDGSLAQAWESEFARVMREAEFTTIKAAYSISSSMSEELDKGAKADIFLFSLTFTLMITYASIVSSGGDCVSTRWLLAGAGVLGVVFGILGAFGLVTLCGVRFVSIVGTMPFLTLGIGVDDMFLLMSSWSETLSMTDLSIPERIATVYRKAGIGITITSVTDFLAFAIGSFSLFRSVQNFCIYTGIGVIMCYICNACMFGACLTFHGRRVYASRHTVTCRKVKSRKELKEDGDTCCCIYLCGGKVPKEPDDDQSLCEQGPRKVLVRILLWDPVRYITLLVFAGYLGVSIWGCTKLRQGLELQNLAPKSSYFYTFQSWDDEDYGVKVPISFVTTKTRDYTDIQILEDVRDLLSKAQEDPLVSKINICWLTILTGTNYYNTASEEAFFSGLYEFLRKQPYFYNDIVFGADNRSITASRCHVYSHTVTDSTEQASLMTRMREVADTSPGDSFAYHPSFVFFEQYVVILPQTLQTVGVTMLVMFFVTCIFLPHPLMVIIVMVQVFMIVTGIFGFMSLWNLTLSSITMIELIMSVGFSVDFCAHVCTAYMVSEGKTRRERVKDAIIHASSPIFNGGVSSFIGVFLLFFTESYIFQSFFKIMILVIGFGVLHAVFLVPVVLSFIGPSAHVRLEQESDPTVTDTTKQSASVAPRSSAIENETVQESEDVINLIDLKVKPKIHMMKRTGYTGEDDEESMKII